MRARIFTIWLVAYVLGSMGAPFFESAPQTYLYLGLALLAGSFLLFTKRYVFGIIFAIGLLFLSMSVFQYREAQLVRKNQILSSAKVTVRGVVSGIPTINEFGQTVVLNIETIDGQRETGKLRVYAQEYPRFTNGQILVFETQIKPYGEKKNRLMKDGFLGEANLNEHVLAGNTTGWWPSVSAVLFGIRLRFNEAISLRLPAAEAGLASGLILGEKALLTPEVTRQLQISGTTHIIALSGYNITIILGLFVVFRKKLSRQANILVPLVFILCFVVMTGGASSLVRAAIMGFVPLIAIYLGRESDSFIAILFSAVIMIVLNPFLALYDVGFQLSFIALAGMIYLAPLVNLALGKLPLSAPLSETIGAQAAAIPLLAFYFGSVSLISPISNLVILALVPAGMLTAFAIGFAGIFWQGFAGFLAIPGYVLLHGINLLIEFFGSIPSASRSIKIENPVWVLLAYFILFDIWLVLFKVKRARPAN